MHDPPFSRIWLVVCVKTLWNLHKNAVDSQSVGQPLMTFKIRVCQASAHSTAWTAEVAFLWLLIDRCCTLLVALSVRYGNVAAWLFIYKCLLCTFCHFKIFIAGAMFTGPSQIADIVKMKTLCLCDYCFVRLERIWCSSLIMRVLSACCMLL